MNKLFVAFLVSFASLTFAEFAQAEVSRGLSPSQQDTVARIRRANEEAERAAGSKGSGPLRGGVGLLKDGQAIFNALKELKEAYEALAARDREYDPSVRPDGAPEVPVSCKEEDCSDCYDKAQDDLNKAMFRLEKLRIIYKRTKTFTTKAIAFGDSASGVHGVVGLTWQDAKRNIEKSVKGLEAAFDKKKPEMMTQLREALDSIGACEEKFFNNTGWYDRFGFMYYQFIDNKYSRE